MLFKKHHFSSNFKHKAPNLRLTNLPGIHKFELVKNFVFLLALRNRVLVTVSCKNFCTGTLVIFYSIVKKNILMCPTYLVNRSQFETARAKLQQQMQLNEMHTYASFSRDQHTIPQDSQCFLDVCRFR